MKNKDWIHLPLSALVAAAVGAALALSSAPERASAVDEWGSDLAPLRETLAALRTEQRALSERMAALPATAAAPVSSRTPLADLDAAVAAYLEKHPLAAAAPADDGLGTDSPGDPDPELSSIVDRILSGEITGDELEALWQRLREEDRIDAVLAEIERLAALEPNNPDLQAELGQAYIQKLFDVGMGPMAAVWGEKADEAFDRALELDEGHWEARFTKAVSLSNWPTFLGKSGEAIRQFEILVEQQERAAPSSRHAQTYYFLGNMYDQNGEREKALAIWRRGLERFPRSEMLLEKTEGGG